MARRMKREVRFQRVAALCYEKLVDVMEGGKVDIVADLDLLDVAKDVACDKEEGYREWYIYVPLKDKRPLTDAELGKVARKLLPQLAAALLGEKP